MLIGRLVYRMEYGEPLSMSQFSFGIFPLFGFRHSLLCLQPNSKQSAQKRHGYELECDDRFWGQQKKQGCGNVTCNPEVSGCRTDDAAGDKCAIYLIIYIALSLGQNFLLVLLYLGDVLLGYGHIVLEVEVVEYGTEWEGLHLLEALAFVLVLAQCGKRLKECLEQ